MSPHNFVDSPKILIRVGFQNVRVHFQNESGREARPLEEVHFDTEREAMMPFNEEVFAPRRTPSTITEVIFER